MLVYVKLEDPERIYTIKLEKFLYLAGINLTAHEIEDAVRKALTDQ